MITLIGNDLAKEGNVFVFYGACDECENCRFKSSCIDSLEDGRKYKVVEVRDVEQKCPIHNDGKVKVVVVENAESTILTNLKSIFEKSKFTFKNFNCDDEDCEYRYLCFPEGLKNEDKCVFIKDLGHFDKCPKGNSLIKTEVILQDNN